MPDYIFRYKTRILPLGSLLSDGDLDVYGSNGWELVSFAIGETRAVYIFKKSIPKL